MRTLIFTVLLILTQSAYGGGCHEDDDCNGGVCGPGGICTDENFVSSLSLKLESDCYRIESNDFGYDQLCLDYAGEPTNTPVTISVLKRGRVVDMLLTRGGDMQEGRHCTKDGDCTTDPRGVVVSAEDAAFEISLYLVAPAFYPGRTAFDSSSISLKKEGVGYLQVN